MKTNTLLLFILFVTSITFANNNSNRLATSEYILETTDPVVPSLNSLIVCDGNNDGYELFNLSLQTPIILAAQSGNSSDYIVQYFLSSSDATLNANSISNSSAFLNTVQNQQTIYVRVENSTTSQFVVDSFLIIATHPIFPAFIPFAPFCQGSPAPSLPITSANGITGTWTPATVSTASLGVSIYTFTPNPGQCASVVTMTITVTTDATLTLASPLGSNNQSVCVNTPIDTITYTIGGDATGATVTGLPASLSAAVFGTTLTIFGTPSTIGTYNYTVTTVGGFCGSMSVNGSIAVGPAVSLNLISSSESTNQNICSNTPITTITYQFGGSATGAVVTGLPSGVTASISGSIVSIYGTPTSTVGSTYTYSIHTTGGFCTQTMMGSITVNPSSTIITANNVNYICVDFTSNTVIAPLVLQESHTGGNNNLTYQWFLNGIAISGATNPTYIVNSATIDGSSREYTVQTTVNSSCSSMSAPFLVHQSGPASLIGIGYTIVNNSGNQTLTVQVEGFGNYQYALDGGLPQTSPVFLNVSLGTHTVTAIDLNGCSNLSINNVDVNLTTVPAPTGITTQSFFQGATLADVQVNGQNVQWYSAASKMAPNTPLPLSTILIDGTTYFASQKIGGYESVDRLPVTVQIFLSNSQFEINGLTFSPNPVIDYLSLKSDEIINAVSVYNFLGQKVLEQNYSSNELQFNLSKLDTGTYFIKVEAGMKKQVIKIIKR